MKPDNQTAQHDKHAAYDWGRAVGEIWRIYGKSKAPTSREVGTGLRGESRIAYDKGAREGFSNPRVKS